MPHRIAAVLAFLSLLGLASPGPAGGQSATPVTLTPAEEQGLQDGRQLVRDFNRLYKPMYSMDLAVASWVGASDLTQMAGVGIVYNRALGKLYINPRLLTSPVRDTLVALALASELVRRPSRATTLADNDLERRQWRLDANAKGVEVLARVRGLTEQAAFERVYSLLAAVQRAQAAAPPASRPAVTACEELQDLQRRFPQHAQTVSPPAC